MADLYDAVDWKVLEGKQGAKAGYVDGAESMWPVEAWQAFQHDTLIHITVLADQTYEAFDGELGNAGPAAVATAIANRIADKKWCWLYSNQDQLPGYLQALKGKGVQPLDRSLFPKPGCYLWLADPSGNIAAARWVPPVDPVAVQDRYEGTFDVSTLFVGLGSAPPPPTPQPPVNLEVTVNVPQISAVHPGPGVVVPWVSSVQAILNVRHNAGLTVDGRFGPNTDQAVRRFQEAAGIGVDGIVGPDTADHLCNH